MKALTIDQMYQLRKWTRSSRRYWGQQRPDNNVEPEDSKTRPAIPRKLRMRIYSNLLLVLIIVAIVVVAAIVGIYVK